MLDQVINWNNVYLQAIRVNGGAPGPIARTGAILHAAIFDAVNSIEKTYKPYLGIIPAAFGASKEAAAVYAAYTVLSSVSVYPNSKEKSQSFFDTELKKARKELENSGLSLQSIDDGKELGIAAAQAIIQNRQGDGFNDNTPYTPGNQPGDWRPTGSGAPVTPNWGKVKPFSPTQIKKFRPTRPGGFYSKQDLLASVEYAAQVNEVKRLGSANSSDRTQEQTDIALFWANDLDGTYKPPGQLYTITQILSKLRGLSFSENARLFALVGLALGDAAILAWDAKYDTNLDWQIRTETLELPPIPLGDLCRPILMAPDFHLHSRRMSLVTRLSEQPILESCGISLVLTMLLSQPHLKTQRPGAIMALESHGHSTVSLQQP